MAPRQQSKSTFLLASAVVAIFLIILTACGGGSDGGSTPSDSSDNGDTTATAQPLATSSFTDDGPSASATIGSAGGTLVSSDGLLTITVPPGAVDTDTVFSITPVASPADNAITTYALTPDGATFDLPVTLTFSAPGAGSTYTAIDGLGIAYHDAQGYWEWLGDVSRDSVANTLSVDVSHFCHYCLFEGFQLSPSSAEVQVGGTVQLQVKYCLQPPVDNPALASLVYECHPARSDEALVSNWSVNGVAGGDAQNGTVTTGADPTATYTAPQHKPDPDTAAVTVEVQDVLGELSPNQQQGKVMLFSLIKVKEDSYSGQFDVTAYGPLIWTNWTAHGTATWTLNEDGEYDVNASITPDEDTYYPDQDTVCVLDEPTQSYNNIGDIHVGTTPTIYWLLFNVQWSATCTDSGGSSTVPNFLVLDWASACGSDWAALDGSYPDHLKGTYTWSATSCGLIDPGTIGIPSATVNWDFLKQN